MKFKDITVSGFKSIDSRGQTIPLDDVTVLLGANGSGKSNLISIFKMINYMTTGGLQNYVAKQGVNSLLFYGPKVTDSISIILRSCSEEADDEYRVTLSHGLSDRLFISREEILYHKKGFSEPSVISFQSGGYEAGLKEDRSKMGKIIFHLLSQIRFYQFHDTSDTAKIKDRGYIDDALYLRSDGGNLAAFLRMLKNHEKFNKYYLRIVRHIYKIMPQFGDFMLDSIPGNENYVRLNWTDIDGSDYLFGPNQISDGTLRFMALATLLLQPSELIPKLIVLDEPELGLHPEAIADLAGMIKIASKNSQILVATQSTRVVDEFYPEQIVIVERDDENRCSVYGKLKTENLKDWLKSYSLSELWEKNVLGGRP